MSRNRILIGDDHSLILEGMKSLLGEHFDIVGTASNGRDLVAEAERLKPDAVVLDISMPVLNGIEAARQIRKEVNSPKIVFVTQTADRSYVQAAFQVGASGYILKQCVPSELARGLKQVLDGYYYVSPVLRDSMLGPLNPKENPQDLFALQLTGRKREVLQLIAEGKSNKEIATALQISVKTVEFHKSGLMDGLGLRTTAELTRYAIEHGVVQLSR